MLGQSLNTLNEADSLDDTAQGYVTTADSVDQSVALIVAYAPSGALAETAPVRVVNGPGSAYTATLYSPGGTFLKYEADLSGGTAYYDASGKPLEFDFLVGGSVVMFAMDGSAVQTNIDGTTLSYALDGTVTVKNKDGAVVQVYAADHSWKSAVTGGWNYYSQGGIFQGSETDSSDGSASFFSATGVLQKVDFANGTYEVYNSNGSVAYFSAAGQLTETVYRDGTMRLVNPSGSNFTATWLKADDTFLKYEADLSGGTAYYGANDKPTEFDYAVGGSVVLFAQNGSSVQTNTDGTKIYYYADGTASVLNQSGVVVQVYAADHSWKSLLPSGWAFYTASGIYLGKELSAADGSISRYDAANRLTECDANDGSKIVYGGDGSVTHTNAAGVIVETVFADGSKRVLDPTTGCTSCYNVVGLLTETDHPDGSKRVVDGPGSAYSATLYGPDGSVMSYEGDLSGGTAYYATNGKPLEFDFAVGGSVVKFNSDGSALQTNTDGTTLFYALDGTITVDDPTGRTVQVYAADHSWKSVTDTGWKFYSPTQVFLGSEIDDSNGDKQLYDASGRLTETDFATGGKVTYEPNGTAKRYGTSGSLIETDFGNGTKTIVQQDTGDILYYNAAGRLTETTAPDGTIKNYASDGTISIYDPSGHLVEEDFADSTKRVFAADGDSSSYDAQGRLIEVDTASGDKTEYTTDGTSCSYNASGALLAITSPTASSEPTAITLQAALTLAEAHGIVATATAVGAPSINERADVTSLGSPPVTGTATANAAVNLYDISGLGVCLVAQGAADANGHWSLTPTTALQAGDNLLSVVQVATGGVSIASISIQLSVADSTPFAPVILQVLQPDDARGLLTVQGTGQLGDNVELGYTSASGENVVGYAPVDSSGNWQIEVPEDALPFGSQQLAVRQLDGAGHESAWSSGTAANVIDPETTAPHVGQDLAAKLANDAATGSDATADLQALANEVQGGPNTVLDIPTGTYVLSHTVYLKSGTIIDSPGTSFVAGKTWEVAASGTLEQQTINYAMFANANWSGSGTPDSAIEFRNVSFDWRGTDSPGAAAVRILNAQNVLVANCTFTGSNSGTAFEADDGAVVKNSTSYETSEYGFDNWYGPKHTVIEDNTVNSGSFGGISLTASPTSGTGAAEAADNAVVGNKIYGFDRIGIDVNTLDTDSTETNTLIADNSVSGIGRGIGVIGPTQDTLVDGNTVLGSNLQAIEVENINPYSGQLEAQDVEVSNNKLGALDMRNSALAAVVVQANGASVVGNIVDGGTFPTGYWIPSNNLLLADNSSSASVSGQQTATWWSSIVSVEGMSALAGSNLIETAQATGSSPGQFSAPEGQGLIVSVPDVTGAVFNAVAQAPGAASATAGASLAAPGDGAAGEQGTLTIFGSGNGDTIHLGTGNDLVYLGGPNETVVGGGGNDTFYAGPSSVSANIDGGSGSSQLVLVPDDQTDVFALGDSIKDISSVKLVISDAPVSLTLNDIPFLQAYASDQGVSIAAGGPDQTIHPGEGPDIMTGWSGGSTTFSGLSLAFYGDTILNLRPTDVIDFTDMAPTAWWDVQADGKGGSYVMASDGHLFTAVDTPALLQRSQFSAADDGNHGLAITMRS